MEITNEKIIAFGKALGRDWYEPGIVLKGIFENREGNSRASKITKRDIKLLAFDWLDKNWDEPVNEDWAVSAWLRENKPDTQSLLEAIIDLAIEMNEVKV